MRLESQPKGHRKNRYASNKHMWRTKTFTFILICKSCNMQRPVLDTQDSSDGSDQFPLCLVKKGTHAEPQQRTQSGMCGEQGLFLDDRKKKIRKVEKTKRTHALSYPLSCVRGWDMHGFSHLTNAYYDSPHDRHLGNLVGERSNKKRDKLLFKTATYAMGKKKSIHVNKIGRVVRKCLYRSDI